MMFAPPMAPMTITDEIAPVGFHRLDSQTVVVDFGRNFAGFCRIRVKGAAGTTVVLRCVYCRVTARRACPPLLPPFVCDRSLEACTLSIRTATRRC